MSTGATKAGILTTLACAIILAATPGWAQGKFATITSGPVGGAWYMLGGSLANMLKDAAKDTKVAVTTGGALGNISKLEEGKAEIGFTMDNLLHEARQGIGSFKDKGPHKHVQGLAYLGDIYMSLFLVLPDSPYKTIEDVKATKAPIRILTAPRASSPSVAAMRMLEGYGITLNDIESWGGKVNFVSYAEAGSLIRDGHADAWVGPMTPPIVEITNRKNLRLLPIRADVLAALAQNYKYGIATMPKGAYPFVSADMPIMTEPMMLIVRDDQPADFVYAFAKAITENRDVIRNVHRFFRDFDPARSCDFVGGPMHPGALKYFKEKGICK